MSPLGSVEELLGFYGERGYAYNVGPGARPAIIVIDFSLAFTGGNARFPGGNFAAEVAATRLLLDAGRARGVPIFFTTLSYQPHLRDAGLWALKVPWLEHCVEGSDLVRIDPALDPRPGEDLLVKKYPSSFFGTGFDARLKDLGIDTLIVSGCTTSVCVRATVVDAMQHGYRALVAADAVGDFNPALHALHLRDIGARYGDVMASADLVRYLLGWRDQAVADASAAR